MATPLQQKSVQRKLIYFALILVLFTAAWAHRRYVVEAKADQLALREQNQGDVELSGSVIRLSLTGSRGFAVCAMWWIAIDKQKKHQWNELEVWVQYLTKLQPHFITPWLFQSWNLAYNVSVESDRPKDKYFYISRGIELLGQGERQNQDNPELRYYMGFTYQDKFGVADEVTTFRCLYQLSCMDPVDREVDRPGGLRPKGQPVNLDEFEKFCQKHPQLVRRLREQLGHRTPDSVVDFLADNQDVPSRYEPGGTPQKPSKLKVRLEEQFPVLVDRDFPGIEPGDKKAMDEVDDSFDAYMAARTWFAYAQVPLPPPNPIPDAGFIKSYDRSKYRLPRNMSSLIFRQSPQRAQTYVAERLKREGWYDEGWEIADWFFEMREKGGRGPEKKIVVGEGPNYALEAWEKSFEMWKAHGERNGLLLTPEQMEGLRQKASVFQRAYKLSGDPIVEPGPDLQKDAVDADLYEGMEAHRQLYWYDRNRQMTNYPRFYEVTRVESMRTFDVQEVKDGKQVVKHLPPTWVARKLVAKADSKRRASDLAQAKRFYEEAFPTWTELLKNEPAWRRDQDVQDESYEIQLNYMKLVQDLEGSQLKQLMVIQDWMTQAAALPPGATILIPSPQISRRQALEVPIRGVFDLKAADGEVLLREETVRRVRSRLGYRDDPPPTPPPPTPPTP